LNKGYAGERMADDDCCSTGVPQPNSELIPAIKPGAETDTHHGTTASMTE
jgi:hypothetical protein